MHNLCTTYQGLNPLQLEQESFHDVIELYARLRRWQIYEEKITTPDRTASGVLRRRASDDAGWW